MAGLWVVTETLCGDYCTKYEARISIVALICVTIIVLFVAHAIFCIIDEQKGGDK